MPLLKTAIDYILGIVTKDETVIKFPKEFVSASAQWIRSWFLKDDEKLAEKLADPKRSVESKKGMIELKLEDALEDPTFKVALEKQVSAYQQQLATIQNQIQITGNQVAGDLIAGDLSVGGDYVKGDQNKATGDQQIIYGDNQTIHHHYYTSPSPGQQQLTEEKVEESKLPQDPKERVLFLLQRGLSKQAVESMLNGSQLVPKIREELMLHSTRIYSVERQVRQGMITGEAADITRNRINQALLYLANEHL